MDDNTPDKPSISLIDETLILFKAAMAALLFVAVGMLLSGFPKTTGEFLFLVIVATYAFFFRLRRRALKNAKDSKYFL